MKVPFVDLHAQYKSIQSDVQAAMDAVVRDLAFVGGPYVETFEKNFAPYCGTRFAYGVSNGTDAIRLALLACGVKGGDEVITVPHTFIATAEAICMIGAQPRFVDVEEETGNLDPRLLERAITPKTKAIVPVHLYGRPADMEAILKIAKAHNLRVVGDAAQAHGATIAGKKIGTWGDAVTFSFYPGKNLGAYGDAGAVVTEDAEVGAKVAALRDHGRKTKYEHDYVGFNCRMDGIQGAVLSAKLKYIEDWTERRICNAALYNRFFEGVPGLITPKISPTVRAVFHLYVIRVANRKRLQAVLQEKGIQTGIHYPLPLHLQPAFSYLGLRPGSFPVSEKLAGEILSLPMYAELSETQIRYVADAVCAALAATAST